MNEPFEYTNDKGVTYTVTWLERSPINRGASCDRCGDWVRADERRLRVDNKEGPNRKAGHGKRHQYMCVKCARNVPTDGGQMELL